MYQVLSSRIVANIHLEARSRCRDSYGLVVEELEKIMFAMIALVLQLVCPAPYASQHPSLHEDGNFYPGSSPGSSQDENKCFYFNCRSGPRPSIAVALFGLPN